YQYVDWQGIRLLESSSQEYRTAVHGLARRLLGIAREVAAKQLDIEINTNLDDDEASGIADIVQKIMVLLPEWLDAVVGEKVNDAQIDATRKHTVDSTMKARRMKAPASTLLAIEMRGARELMPLLERKQKDAEIYLARSVELDPLISSLV